MRNSSALRTGLSCPVPASLAALSLASLVGISSGCVPGGGDDRAPARALQPLAGCADVEAAMRAAAIRAMEARVDQNLRSALAWREMGWCGGYYGDGRDDAGTAGGGLPPAPASEGESGPSGYSDTNTQVAGVDEADFVKTDGLYLYLVTGSTLRIVKAWPPTEAAILSTTALEGTAHKLFLKEDRVLVYSSLTAGSPETDGAPAWGGGRPCTYGYSCSFTGDGHPTKVTVLDVADRAAPAVLREVWLSGSFVNARRIGSAIYTIVSAPGGQVPEVAEWPADVDVCATSMTDLQVKIAFLRLKAQNRRLLEEASVGTWKPAAAERLAGAATRRDLQGSCDSFFAPAGAEGTALTSIVSLDLDEATAPRFATIVSEPGAVYASAESLYLAVPRGNDYGYDWYGGGDPATPPQSDVHRFHLDTELPGALYAASGAVKGRVLNQFSMDEHEGVLRIATTSGHVPDPSVHSTVTILAQEGIELVPVGLLDHLAPTEDIRSVRFAGDRGFIVTFKKTDPLFLLDLSNPLDPIVMAELHIPGFSTYMQLMDPEHLLTIGYDADDQGDFAWFQGVQLQIFDVGDPASPSLAHRELIGTRGSSSEALTNHLAFNYYAPANLLAIPMTICEGGSGGSYGDTMTFSGLLVYDVTAADGFALRGGVPHPTGSDIGCWNWWTDASSQVKRSIIMDDYVFSISDSLIKANRLDSLSQDVAVLPL